MNILIQGRPIYTPAIYVAANLARQYIVRVHTYFLKFNPDAKLTFLSRVSYQFLGSCVYHLISFCFSNDFVCQRYHQLALPYAKQSVLKWVFCARIPKHALIGTGNFYHIIILLAVVSAKWALVLWVAIYMIWAQGMLLFASTVSIAHFPKCPY